MPRTFAAPPRRCNAAAASRDVVVEHPAHRVDHVAHAGRVVIETTSPPGQRRDGSLRVLGFWRVVDPQSTAVRRMEEAGETTVVVVERAESWSDGTLHTPHIQTSQRVREHTSDMLSHDRVVAMSDHGISTQRLDDYFWVVALSGEHDLSDVAEVERAIASVFDEGSVPVIDLTQATLVDSTVMDAILFYAHELTATSRDRDMAVIATPETHTRSSLELGLCGYINVYTRCQRHSRHSRSDPLQVRRSGSIAVGSLRASRPRHAASVSHQADDPR